VRSTSTLNTSGDGGSLDELSTAVADLDEEDEEVHRLDGQEGTEHVSLYGSEAEVTERARQVLAAVFGMSSASPVESPDSSSRIEPAQGPEQTTSGPAEVAGSGAPATRRPLRGWTRSDPPERGFRRIFMQEPLAVSSAGLVVIGGLAVGAAMAHSRLLTGDWIGSPLPTPTDVALGLGGLVLFFGVAMGAIWGLFQLIGNTAFGDLLYRPMVGRNGSLARTGTWLIRSILSVFRGFRFLQLVAAFVVVVWLAF
jgi:hypothetical protein